jgi:porphyrinogen peroxidase
MATPQQAIFRENTPHHYFIECNLQSGWSAADLGALLARVLPRQAAEQDSSMMIAFGQKAWEQLAPAHMPENFISFHPVLGRDDRTAPGTQSDLLFWIHGPRHDINLARAMRIARELAAVATLELELHGFCFLDSRDMTGFIDGSENPHDQEARDTAVIPAGQPGAGGCFVLTQQWLHDLPRFQALPLHEQEQVIGRTRADSIELDDAPPSAHVRRTDVKIDGSSLKIYRRSTPWGGVRQHGLYFLAFSRELMRFALQLDRMFGLAEDGIMDRLTEFSTPLTGSYWYAPPDDILLQLFGTTPALEAHTP